MGVDPIRNRDVFTVALDQLLLLSGAGRYSSNLNDQFMSITVERVAMQGRLRGLGEKVEISSAGPSRLPALRREPFSEPDGPKIGSQLMINGLSSLEPHVIFYGHHALDTARNADSLVNIFLRVDETAQLHHAFEGFDVNLR